VTGRWRGLAAVAVVATFGTAVAAAAAFIAWPLPPALTAPLAQPALTLTDRDGVVLRTTRAADGSRARWIPIADIDAKLIAAFVATEDRRFFSHGAIDWRAVARASWHNVRARRVVSGASTIAMQTARLLHPTPRTIPGKLSQTLWALRLGAHLSRQEVLEQYLNRVELGQGAVGVESGAALYFGASAQELSVGQAAMLAGLAHAPSADNPLVSQSRARARRALALARMRGAGAATDADVALATQEPVLAPLASRSFLAPHFTTHFLATRGDSLIYARSASAPSGDFRTSLDYTLERDVELEVRRTVLDLRERGVEQAAAVVLDNRTGEVLAWVGSPDFFADTSGQTDMVISPRQPGSALKPFLYGLAFDRGFTPASILADIPRTYQTSTGPYHPRNYDRRYHGPVRARDALASSYNIPAVELAQQLGAGSLLQTLHLAGFASLHESADYYGLGLALGNGDVSLLELANGYRALANRGVWHPITMLARVEPRVGADESRRVMTPIAAALVLDILADPVARAPGFGIESALEFPFPAAVKTGTSRHFTDNWAVAATSAFTVAVWVGNFNGRPMDGVSGVTGAGPLMHRIVMHTAARYEPGALPSPASMGATAAEVCQLSGLLAADGCPSLTEWFAPGTAPTARDDWHRGNTVTLPSEYAEWRAQGGDAMLDARGDSAHRSAPTLASEPRSRRFRIASPQNGDRYQVPPGVDARYATIALRAEGADPSTVHWFVDGLPTSVRRLPLVAGTHVIRASASAAQSDEVRVTIER